jgi:N-acyl-D-amino-acid deacylase
MAMHCRTFVVVAPIALVLFADSMPVDASEASSDAVRGAIAKAIPLLETGTRGSADQRECFTCHSQAVPVFALAEARTRGFTIDEANFERQVEHTAAHLERGFDAYREGRGQGGRVLTAGYALWTLEAGGRGPDEVTGAVTAFLVQYQRGRKHWRHPGSRPPSSGSDFTATYVALRGLSYFATQEQRPQIEARIAEVREWLLSETPRDTEDRVFRLWAIPYVDAGEEVLQGAVAELLNTQRGDGGWAQQDDMESDAYATATALVALMDAGRLAADHPAIVRGAGYLIDNQLDDGSWHVATRANPFQTYFESGFPHGKDQFISMAASGWATLALLLALSE